MTLVFVVVTMLLSMWRKLGLEKDIAVGTVRSSIQLLAIGYVLLFVFRTENPLLIIVIICIMISVAVWNATQRAKPLTGVLWRIALAIVTTETAAMGMLLLLRLVEPTPQYIIPLSGMVVHNAMIVCGLFFNQMKREVDASLGEIETLLALGATARQAVQEPLKRAVRASMIPTIDSMKTVGLVQLPGMMTGMIIAGASPLEAVRYQILITFLFSASSAVTAILLSGLSYNLWFTKDEQLRVVK